MSGWWFVQVKDNGLVYSASRAYASDEAQFEQRGDAEDLVEEIEWWYGNTHPNRVVQFRLVFRNEHGVVQETEWA
jgi:hypothetical protein